jgi:hypothetical protein
VVKRVIEGVELSPRREPGAPAHGKPGSAGRVVRLNRLTAHRTVARVVGAMQEIPSDVQVKFDFAMPNRLSTIRVPLSVLCLGRTGVFH